MRERVRLPWRSSTPEVDAYGRFESQGVCRETAVWLDEIAAATCNATLRGTLVVNAGERLALRPTASGAPARTALSTSAALR